MTSRVKFSEIAELVMGQSPTGSDCNGIGDGIPLLNGPTEFTERSPLPVQFTTAGKKFSKVGDILFCVRGSTTGRMNYSDQTYAIGRGIGAIRGINGYPTVYVRAVLERNLERLLVAATGSTFPNVGKDLLNNFEVDVCSPEQAQHANTLLVALEDKRYLNSQTNQTLEQMAQAIFKSWFVDFDPVKAKMSGEQPEGMDVATASLFPEKLVESELGLIPDGWEPKQLKDIVELAYGKALKKTDRVAGDVPVYGSGGLTGYHNQSLVEGPGIIVGRKGTVGSVYWEPKAFYPIDTVFYVKPKAGYSLKYCHLVLQNLGLKAMNTDAAVPGLNRNNAYRLDVITPSESVLKKFEEMMQSFQSKVDANNAQNASLESLRDTLLPKLLSGEIDLEKAQNDI
ncbi:restriction endonuclease subunit S [Vibrio mediterranei]|uniref:restriction endonuclease subunit S n=1 Tax=Vibrio mediterranei TaxID=689 RepID=UPI00148C629F|nr:restriction endonuclease subunit S [Vibrio mediterranei]